jgi:hypothetical protein
MDELIVATAGTGVARTSHYVTPTGASAPIQTLLLEPQRTNLCIRSEEFDTWTNISTCNVTANAVVAPDGTTTADLLSSTVTGSSRGQTVTFTGDGEKAIALYLKAGTSALTQVRLLDTTASLFRHTVAVTWVAGVPSLSTVGGAGTLYPVEALANGWYRILFSATGVVAANVNQFRVQPDPTTGTGNVYAWGAQTENAIVPSSYIKTQATTVTRNADSLYFPFTAPPQAMTVYVREVNCGNFATETDLRRYVNIGDSVVSTDPRFGLSGLTNNRFSPYYDNGVTSVSVTVIPSPTPVLRDLVETRAALRSDWSVLGGISVNGGAEVTGTSVVSGAALAFAQPRLYVAGLSSQSPLSALTHVIVAAGEQTMATMRSLAGVA